jgi:cytochrome c5
MDVPKDAPAPAAAPKTDTPKAEAETKAPEATKTDTEEKTETKPAVEATTETVTPPATPVAPVTPTTPETPVTPTTESAAPIKEAAPALAAVEQESSISGEEIYKATCFACHGMGVAGAPKIGDKAAWEARIAKGNEVLHTSAIKGIQSTTGVMPPKGGNFSLSDDEVKAAVDYMVSEVK